MHMFFVGNEFVVSFLAHKDSTGAPLEQRWEMLQLACADNPALIPDDRGRPRWLETGGVRRALQYLVEGTDRLWLQDGSGGQECFTDITHREPEAAAGAGTGQIRAPMDGAIVSIQVRQGDRVSRGQTLAVLEAMKMEHQLRADLDGTVAEIGAAPGDQVKSRQLIIRVEEASEGLPVPEEARS